jgi:hypothetical protein
MPRPTLPKCLERVSTMNVMITHHTESDVWNHMCAMMKQLESKGGDYYEAWSDFVNDIFHDNPYDKYSINDWRLNKVKRLTNATWRDDWTDADNDEFMKLMSICRDLTICDNGFGWSETKEEFGDMKNQAEKFWVHFDTNEFKYYEAFKYEKSLKKYKTDDAEYIKERSEYRNHEDTHITGNLPTQRIAAQSYETDAKCRSIVDEAKKTCKYCIELVRMKKEREEAEIEHERKAQEDSERWHKQQEEKRKQEEALRRRPSRMFNCDDCDYHTTNSHFFDDHMESREHKTIENLKKWKCSTCNVQSRCTQEHLIHTQSKKHLKLTGQFEEEEVKHHECKACSYSTPYKQVYQTHCKSAKHLKNIA